uniref:Cytochrome P450 n=1 Tax=Bionectria ochroleuca TaxID=29856 RepID=A0A0B7KF85_BIOOC
MFLCPGASPTPQRCDRGNSSIAVPGNLPRVVPDGGISLEGYAVPEGIEVETQAYSLHRDPNVLPDPLTFDETRWRGKDRPKPRSYCPFGAGTRTCAGTHLARMEFGLKQQPYSDSAKVSD